MKRIQEKTMWSVIWYLEKKIYHVSELHNTGSGMVPQVIIIAPFTFYIAHKHIFKNTSIFDTIDHFKGGVLSLYIYEVGRRAEKGLVGCEVVWPTHLAKFLLYFHCI